MGDKTNHALTFHAAVRMKDCIVVVGTCAKDDTHTYNLWTGQWKKCQIHVKGRELPTTKNIFGAEIRSVIYMFHG